LAQAGLIILNLEEYLFCNGEKPFADMVPSTQRRMVAPSHIPKIPLLYGIAAQKGAE
jgi:hypothetical protein